MGVRATPRVNPTRINATIPIGNRSTVIGGAILNQKKTTPSKTSRIRKLKITCPKPDRRIASRGRLILTSMDLAAMTVLRGLFNASAKTCQIIVPISAYAG